MLWCAVLLLSAAAIDMAQAFWGQDNFPRGGGNSTPPPPSPNRYPPPPNRTMTTTPYVAGFECMDVSTPFGGSILLNPTTVSSTCDDQASRLNEALNTTKLGVSWAVCGKAIAIGARNQVVYLAHDALTFDTTEECDAYSVELSEAITALSRGEAHTISCLRTGSKSIRDFLFVVGDIATCEAAVRGIHSLATTAATTTSQPAAAATPSPRDVNGTRRCDEECTAAMFENDACDAGCNTYGCRYDQGHCSRATVQAWHEARVVAVTGNIGAAVAAFEKVCAIPLGMPNRDVLASVGLANFSEAEHVARVRDFEVQKMVVDTACTTVTNMYLGAAPTGRATNDVGGQLSWTQMKVSVSEQLATLEAMEAKVDRATDLQKLHPPPTTMRNGPIQPTQRTCSITLARACLRLAPS